ncbi:unnamed protein product [Alopecurus aequalis]
MEDTTLASELDRLQGMARELGACVVDDQTAPAAARDLCAALAASVDRAARLLAARNGHGAAGRHGRSSNVQPRNSCRTDAAKVRLQVRVASVQDTRPLDDGLSWRKYGQKDILGALYPRAYFRCTHRHTRSCHATKQVQRADADPLLFDVVYNGAHTCDPQGAATSPELQQQPPVFSQEQGSPAAPEAQTIRWPGEPLTPFSFPSSPDGAIDDLLASYGYGATGEADMDLEPLLEGLFYSSSELFQSEIQSL